MPIKNPLSLFIKKKHTLVMAVTHVTGPYLQEFKLKTYSKLYNLLNHGSFVFMSLSTTLSASL